MNPEVMRLGKCPAGAGSLRPMSTMPEHGPLVVAMTMRGRFWVGRLRVGVSGNLIEVLQYVGLGEKMRERSRA